MIDDLFQNLPTGLSFSLLADDSSIWCTTPELDHGVQRLQHALYTIEQWSSENGILVVSLKYFSRFFYNRHNARATPMYYQRCYGSPCPRGVRGQRHLAGAEVTDLRRYLCRAGCRAVWRASPSRGGGCGDYPNPDVANAGANQTELITPLGGAIAGGRCPPRRPVARPRWQPGRDASSSAGPEAARRVTVPTRPPPGTVELCVTSARPSSVETARQLSVSSGRGGIVTNL